MATIKPVKFYATRTFKDAGTGASFEGGKQHEATEGEVANYTAAGLATDKKPDAAAEPDVQTA